MITPKRIGTNEIRELIPAWVSDLEIEKLRKEFDPEIPFHILKNIMRKSANWKRIGKHTEGNEIERVFDCTPLDDQLRLYDYVSRKPTTFSRWMNASTVKFIYWQTSIIDVRRDG